MKDSTRKFIITSFWIVFIIISISIYTFQALVHTKTDVSSFTNFIVVIALICILIVLLSYLGQSKKLPYMSQHQNSHTCSICGFKNNGSSEYCLKCGKHLRKA